MNSMQLLYVMLSAFVAAVGFLPLLPLTHWTVRPVDFIRLQLGVLLIVLLGLSAAWDWGGNQAVLSVRIFLVASLVYQVWVVAPYVRVRRFRLKPKPHAVTLISVNVKQENSDYERLLNLIDREQPDLLLTLETNADWEEALRLKEPDYRHICHVPQENRYGLHFYSRLEVESCEVHALVAEDFPSVEATLKDVEGRRFRFWGIHPPPPSPTEKPTSRQKDAELAALAVRLRDCELPTLVTGDFNNVCWSRSSKLFARTTGLIDGRKGRGFHSSFPVRPWWLRFPIDLVFHSPQIELHSLQTLHDIGSDHLPIRVRFWVASPGDFNSPSLQQEDRETLAQKRAEGAVAAREEN